MDSIINWTLLLLGLIINQLLFGKKISFPYGILIGINLYVISITIILTDLLLMVFIDRSYCFMAQRVFPFTLIQKKVIKYNKRLEESLLSKKVLFCGKASAMIITAVPFAGGVWSGLAIAYSLNINKIQTYWLVGAGTVIGCGIFYIAAEGVLQII
jgi:uncharacterized membrane protein